MRTGQFFTIKCLNRKDFFFNNDIIQIKNVQRKSKKITQNLLGKGINTILLKNLLDYLNKNQKKSLRHMHDFNVRFENNQA